VTLRAPVALFAFNRPETTAQVFAAIREARPSRLFLVCDAPRADRPEEAARCAAVRAILDGVDWPCEVERAFADQNMGCRRRISSGIDWVFSRTDEAIFLEDDTLPEPTFFRYADELLERYRDDDRVLMISAYNLMGAVHGGAARSGATGATSATRSGATDAPDASYWFSLLPRIWGWAGWRRAWQGYDVTMADWPALKQTPAWTERTVAEREAYGPFFDEVKAGRMDTWDAQVCLHAWRTGRVAAIPAVNLITNIGFGGGATNTHLSAFPGPPVQPMAFPLVHPAQVARDVARDARWVRLEHGVKMGRAQRWWRGAMRRLRALVGGASNGGASGGGAPFRRASR
jgi:hypothetical protein